MDLQFDITNAGSMKKVVIKGKFFGEKTFPSLNNLLENYAKKPAIGGAMKRKYKKICSEKIRQQIGGYVAEKPLIIHYRLFEPNRGQRRDVMNCVAMVDKCFEDALQECKVIPDDGPEYVKNITHDVFYTDEKDPWFEAFLEEVDD